MRSRTLRGAVLGDITGIGPQASLYLRHFALAVQLLSADDDLSPRQWEMVRRGMT